MVNTFVGDGRGLSSNFGPFGGREMPSRITPWQCPKSAGCDSLFDDQTKPLRSSSAVPRRQCNTLQRHIIFLWHRSSFWCSLPCGSCSGISPLVFQRKHRAARGRARRVPGDLSRDLVSTLRHCGTRLPRCVPESGATGVREGAPARIEPEHRYRGRRGRFRKRPIALSHVLANASADARRAACDRI
jgi:hypothetical protein